MATITTSKATSTRSYLGPLTTTWTPPAQCTVFGPGGNTVSAANFYLAQDCSGGSPHDATSCRPPALVTNPFPAVLNGYGYYSPGIVCPTGYYSACGQDLSHSKLTGSLSKLASFDFQFPLIDGETAVGCCPTGMTCAKPFSGYQTCISKSAASRDVISIGFCGSSATYTKTSKLTIGKAIPGLYGPLIQLVYKATDISSAAVTTSAAGTTTSIPVDPAPGSAATSRPLTDTGGDDDGLSTGAKIGIGVGVPLGVLFLAALVFFFFRRRRGRRASIPIDMPYEAPNEAKNAIITGGQSSQYPKEPLKANQNAELDGTSAPTVHELSAETSLR